VTEESHPALSITVTEPSEGLFVVALVGDLDIASADELLPILAGLPINARSRVVVDVSGLAFIDSSGLNALVIGARAVEADDGWIVVAGASEHIARVFDVVRLAESVEVEASVLEALRRAESKSEVEQIGPP
jgi:anti-anti-sigma factor